MTKRARPGDVVACASWPELLARVERFFAGPSDPFVTDTLVVPTAGHGRYVAQHLARSYGGGSGVCAGIAMVTPGQLAHRLAGASDGDDPWHGASRTLAIAEILAGGPQWPPLAGAGGLAFAESLGRVFDGYAQDCPAMVLSWDEGRDVGPTGTPLTPAQSWQAQLWRELCARLEPWPHPALVRLAAADRVSQMTGRTGVLLVCQPRPVDQPLIDALQAGGAPVWTYRPVDPDRPAVAVDDQPASLLRRVQTDTASQRPPTGPRRPDGTIRIHASHGPSRQVEVLRDVLCSLFDDIPDLEPRDVLVLTTDQQTYGPLIADAFAPTSRHPAGSLRVQVAGQRDNPLIAGLLEVLALAGSRAGADQLLAWCRRPDVARRFGLTPGDLERITDLVRQAGVVWGVDSRSRLASGVDVRRGTWLDGVDRLILALCTTDGTSGAMPAGGVQPEDSDVIGVLAEVVSRLRRALLDSAEAAPLRTWAERLAQMTEDLFLPAPDDAWALADLNALLAAWRREPTTIAVPAGDVSDLLRARLTSEARPTYGNGALQVRPLGELQGVSFRVICVIGLDDASFPAPLLARADDLLFDAGLDDARRRSRAALRDALLAAQDAFVVMTRGADERTGAPLPAPVAVLDLLAACGVPGPAGSWTPAGGGPALVRRHPLQPYAWPAFASEDAETPPPSYDRQALRAASQLMLGPAPAVPAWTSLSGDAPNAPVLTLDDIESFLTNPARHLLRRACGLSLSEQAEAWDPSLPLQLDALTSWSIGQGLLDDMMAGLTPSQARDRAMANPATPPGTLGAGAVASLLTQATALAGNVAALGPPTTVAVDLALAGRRLTGAVPTRGTSVVVTRFGRLKAAQLITVWVRLLAAAAQGPADGLTGLAWSCDAALALAPPSAEQARSILAQIADLAVQGTSRLVPLPVETSAALAGVLRSSPADPERRATDAFAGRFGEGRQPAWLSLLGEPSLTALRRVGPPSFDELSHWLWQPVMAALRRGDAR